VLWTTQSKKDTPALVRFKDQAHGMTGSASLSALISTVAADPDSEVRRFVDLGTGQHCHSSTGLYDLGVLSHFTVSRPFFECFSLCLSRACLGKTQKDAISHPNPSVLRIA
jgi:hypothetical protein